MLPGPSLVPPVLVTPDVVGGTLPPLVDPDISPDEPVDVDPPSVSAGFPGPHPASSPATIAAPVRLAIFTIVAIYQPSEKNSPPTIATPLPSAAMLAGLTRDEVLHEALVRPREARGAYIDVRVVERPDWFQIITPSFRKGGFNEVAFARLADDEADAVIDATIAEYADHDIRFRWTVTPDCRPRDLPERLARRGFVADRCIVMAAAVADLQIPPADDVAVEPVDHHNLERYIDVVVAGWDADPAPLLAYHRAVLDAGDARCQCFLATRDGAPAGAALSWTFARSLYLLGAVVLPPHRARGVYRSLLAARLRHAAAHGVDLLTTHARSSTSAPILARLGFHALCELPVFFNR